MQRDCAAAFPFPKGDTCKSKDSLRFQSLQLNEAFKRNLETKSLSMQLIAVAAANRSAMKKDRKEGGSSPLRQEHQQQQYGAIKGSPGRLEVKSLEKMRCRYCHKIQLVGTLYAHLTYFCGPEEIKRERRFFQEAVEENKTLDPRSAASHDPQVARKKIEYLRYLKHVKVKYHNSRKLLRMRDTKVHKSYQSSEKGKPATTSIVSFGHLLIYLYGAVLHFLALLTHQVK